MRRKGGAGGGGGGWCDSRELAVLKSLRLYLLLPNPPLLSLSSEVSIRHSSIQDPAGGYKGGYKEGGYGGLHEHGSVLTGIPYRRRLPRAVWVLAAAVLEVCASLAAARPSAR
jgi:hypothetical protein